MSPELHADVELDLTALRREIDETAREREEMLARPADDPPSGWDMRAAAGLLHQCYAGMENALKRIITTVDGSIPRGDGWHSTLLKQAAVPTAKRAAILSAALLEDLRELMGFRHVARVHYGQDFDWNRMAPLLRRLPDVVARFTTEVRAFLDFQDLRRV